MAASAWAWRRDSWPSARKICRCRFIRAARKRFISRKTATRHSSWSVREPASRRFALFCRNAKRSARAAKRGSSSARSANTRDYFYRDDFAAFKKEGYLTRIDTAFSRDQAQKIYVQHRMQENAAEIWKWLEEGAEFFVCGDAKRMAKDVDATLRKIVQEQGGKDIEAANEYIEKLKSDKRYKRDVY